MVQDCPNASKLVVMPGFRRQELAEERTEHSAPIDVDVSDKQRPEAFPNYIAYTWDFPFAHENQVAVAKHSRHFLNLCDSAVEE